VSQTGTKVGQGTLSVQPLVFRLVCKNGLIASDRALRKTHVGRILESTEESMLVFKDDTLRADDTAFFLKVREVVEAAASEAMANKTVRIAWAMIRNGTDYQAPAIPA
jgi:hypothetical protein